MNKKLKNITALMKRIAKEVCPAKVLRKEVVTWMTSEIQELRRRRNGARRDMTRKRRSEWTEIYRDGDTSDISLCDVSPLRGAGGVRRVWG